MCCGEQALTLQKEFVSDFLCIMTNTHQKMWEELAAGAHKLAVSEIGPATDCARAAGRTEDFHVWLQVRLCLRLLSSLPFSSATGMRWLQVRLRLICG